MKPALVTLSVISVAVCAVCLLPVAAVADHPERSGPFPHITHIEMTGMVTKIEPSMLFVQPPQGLRPRTISTIKAERMGLQETKVGDTVTLVVDEGNVLIDAHKSDVLPAGHRIITGTLTYAKKFWQELKISTPEGIEDFAVDPLAGSKLAALREGESVVIELDEANVVIDMHRD
jgi:hypothetical protein